MSEPLLQVHNHPAASGGDPPVIKGDDPYICIGYFENEHNEQWIFTFDRRTGKAELRGGDALWDVVYAVWYGRVYNLLLSHTEKIWLKTCRAAATYTRTVMIYNKQKRATVWPPVS